MKKSYLFGLISLVIVIAVIVGVTSAGGKSDNTSNDTKKDTQTATTGDFKPNLKDACTILTQSVATNLLGADANKGDTSTANVETNDVKVTACNYNSASTHLSLGLLVRAAESQTQADSNTAQFSDKANIPGYGDKAYWDSTYGQFNILAHNNWYILTYGPLNPTDSIQADGQKLADAIKAQL